MLSRILGLLREVAYTRFMGTTWVADAFNLAFMVPNLFRRLLGEGALTAAFIPIFKEKEKSCGPKEMWHAANAVTSALAAASTLVVAAGMTLISIALIFPSVDARLFRLASFLQAVFPAVAAFGVVAAVAGWVLLRNGTVSGPPWRWVFFAGVGVVGMFLLFLALSGPAIRQAEGGRTLLMLELLRVMFPYLLFVCVAAVFIGMLNARGHFFVPAMGATLLNVVMISSVYFLAPRLGLSLEQQIFGLAIGVLIAGIAQAVVQLPLLKQEGFTYRWVSPWRDPTVARVMRQMIPGTVGVAAFQINVLLTQSMAFWVGKGVVSSFAVAVRLMELPQGVFGISLATYLLPTLSGLAAEKKYPEFRSTLIQGLDWLVFFNLLAAVLLFTLAEPMIRLLFQRGLFDASSTYNSALALKCLAPGLVAFSVVNVLARAFYALSDTQTPMRISVFCLVVNLLLAGVLVSRYQQAGLGLANTASALMNMSLLFYALRRKLRILELGTLRRDLPFLAVAAAAAGGTAWVVERWWENHPGHATFWMKVGEVGAPILAATAVYLGIAAATRAGHMRELAGLLQARLKRRK